MMNELISNFKATTDETDSQIKWELLKIQIRELSINFCQIKKRKESKTLEDLQRRLNTFDIALANNPSNIDIQQLRQKTKNELEIFEQHVANSARVRAQVKHIEEGEKKLAQFQSNG